MKKIILILAIFLSNCDKCDSKRYQVHDKVDLNNGSCKYTMWANTDCASWSVREIFSFTASCGKFQLSQIVPADSVAKYR